VCIQIDERSMLQCSNDVYVIFESCSEPLRCNMALINFEQVFERAFHLANHTMLTVTQAPEANDSERISDSRGSGALLRSSKFCMGEPVVLLRPWNKI